MPTIIAKPGRAEPLNLDVREMVVSVGAAARNSCRCQSSALVSKMSRTSIPAARETGKRRVLNTVRSVVSAFLAGLLAACSTPEPPPEPHTPVAVRAVNYTDQGAFFSINQAAGGSVVAHWESGINCCIGIPDTWRPGLKVKVYVRDDELWFKYQDPTRWQVTELEVPRYERPGDLFVAILPDRLPELVVSSCEPGGPCWDYRLAHPRSECLKTRSKRFCGAE